MLFMHLFDVFCVTTHIKYPKNIKEENSSKDTVGVNKNDIYGKHLKNVGSVS